MCNEYTVYWYRLQEHSNPYEEGYIGITNDITRRHKEHMYKASTDAVSHFYNAIRKYGSEKVIQEVLHVCTKEEALDIEYSYRPSLNIGWNAAIGGEDTLSSVNSTPITLYHKDNPDVLQSFDSIKEAAETLKISKDAIVQRKYRQKSVYGYDGWAVLFDKNFDRSTTITAQEAVSKGLTGIKKNKPSHFKGNTDRWTDEQKATIGSYHKGKTISVEHKKSMSEKMKAQHSSCKQVTLVHIDDKNKEYTYHSISEASRQLELPLARLKSKAQRKLGVFGKDGWAITQLGSE